MGFGEGRNEGGEGFNISCLKSFRGFGGYFRAQINEYFCRISGLELRPRSSRSMGGLARDRNEWKEEVRTRCDKIETLEVQAERGTFSKTLKGEYGRSPRQTNADEN